MLLNKVPHDRFHFLEAALLAAQPKHLQPKNARSVFRLQALSDGEGLLRETFTIHEMTLHQSPRGPKVVHKTKH
jgi:hypothetical protein